MNNEKVTYGDEEPPKGYPEFLNWIGKEPEAADRYVEQHEQKEEDNKKDK